MSPPLTGRSIFESTPPSVTSNIAMMLYLSNDYIRPVDPILTREPTAHISLWTWETSHA